MLLRETEKFIRGRNGEQIIAGLLQDKDWFVVPSYDYSGEDGNKTPRLQGRYIQYVLPDLDVAKDGIRIWVEVKTKKKADWTRCTQRHEHGLPRRHWDCYLKVQEVTGCQVWLFVYEEETGDILCQSLDRLAVNARFYDGGKMSRGGMVFLARDAFYLFASLKRDQ